ncbi:alanine racemase [Streptomyces sp. P1-3]|uniref:alanine racemase n=1 Tax=Streptomyces sp. P1-3 TaxID=3421658 RepID=UPI003D36E447
MTIRPPAGVSTPALVVDADILERNIARMADRARTLGFALRPHAKTHKSPRLAEYQIRAGATGLSVATIGEAEIFADAGVEDLFIAYPLWVDEGKARRLRSLAERVALSVGVDSVEGAAQLGRAMSGAARPLWVLIEIDSGHHRTGVAPDRAAAVARAATDAGLLVRGVFTFPGHGYGPEARESAARDEERTLGEAARAIEGIGLTAPVISGGSTPTAGAARAGVVNELRPGVYVFNDATQVALGSCTVQDVALAAAATVVSVPAPDRFVLDAGSKILSTDTSPHAPGHGLLPELPGAVVTSLSEHHAVVTLAPGTPPPRPGTLLAVVPNHVCTAVNLADELLVTRGGAVVDRWPVTARGANS